MKKIISKIKVFLINFNDNYPVLLFFIVSNLINGMLVKLLTIGRFQLRPILFDMGFLLLLGAFSFFIKKRENKNLYYVLWSIIMVAICVINSIYFNYYESFVSASLIATSVFVGEVGDAVVNFALKIKDFIYVWQIFGLIYCIKNMKKEINVRDNFNIMTLLAVIVIGVGCVLPPYSWDSFIKLWSRVKVVEGFGIYTYQIDDLIQSLRPAFNDVFGHDKALQETKEYFQKNTREKSSNEYTGIFEGKNVIAIHAESLQAFTLGLSFNGKEVTPNLNKLISKGMYFSNFYAQQGVGTSSDSEFTYSSSLLPANNGTVFVNYYNNKYVTMQNLLNDKGYYVFSMHGNVGPFWNREVMHLNMGYDKFYSKSSFEIDEEFGLGLSDASFFRQVVPMIKEINQEIGSPYYGTLITLTNHTPWKETELFSDYDVSKSVKINGELITRKYLEETVLGNYIKSVNYMDQAIGNFFEEMEKEGLLDETVIVIYGDHESKIDKKYFNYMYNYNASLDEVIKEGEAGYVEFNNYDYELNKKVPLIIWSKDMEESVEIKTPMGMIDVMPTLGNMLNIYNPYALGNDIMNIKNGENIVVFKNGSYITDKVYYNEDKEEVYMIKNSVISEEYLENNRRYADEIIKISNNIISFDLLNELDSQ